MKKLLTAAAICLICADAYALTAGGTTCIQPVELENCFSVDSTSCSCDVINACTSESVGLPVGYSGDVTRGIVVTTSGSKCYCSCGMKSGTLSCAPGYTGTAKYTYSNGNDIFSGCTKESTCDGTCDDCVSTDWTPGLSGLETQTTATCNKLTCECTKIIDTRCQAGYYGSGRFTINGTDPCTICPSSGGIAGQSVTGSNTKITDCYIPANTSMSDGTGTYTYTNNCYYTEEKNTGGFISEINPPNCISRAHAFTILMQQLGISSLPL